MNCDKIDDSLPLYIDGELPDEVHRSVQTHLGECASCRESLALYQTLESSLASRRELRPPAGRTGVLVVERLGLRRKWSWVRAWTGLPGLAGALFIVLGVVSFFSKTPLLESMDRLEKGFLLGYSPVLDGWTRGVAQVSEGIGEWGLLSVYAGVFALIMLTGSWMVLRFVLE